MFDWHKLLSSERFSGTTKSKEDRRTEYERDYDRIIYCSAFRRLQDKAQVFPLERKDFVRTRLTHSLEVSTLSRSLGVEVARALSDRLKMGETYDDSFGDILSSVALIHDLGNPPFGHFAEEAIGHWFTKYFDNKQELKDSLKYSAKEFTDFEGNAQTFRIVSRLQVLTNQHGLNLTFATLSSLLKYPRASYETDENKGASFEKYGYFDSEKERFERIIEATGLKIGEKICRHPLAFLLEAADDIAYSAGDVEDGFKKGVLLWDELVDVLKDNLSADDNSLIALMKTEKRLRDENRPEPRYNAVQFFRITSQGEMLRACVKVFINNFENIMNGSFDKNLLKISDAANLYEVLKKKLGRKKVYVSEEVLRQEIVANKVISGLLDMFVPALLSDSYENPRCHDGKLYQLISQNFRKIFESEKATQYNRLRLVTDYISGMTDSYAMESYQKLYGFRNV
jgi:dGTPase